MTYDTLIKTSNIVLAAKNICQAYSFIRNCFFNMLRDSLIYKFFYVFREINQNILKYSIMSQTVERIGRNSEGIRKDSFFLRRALAAVRVYKHKLNVYFVNSFMKSFYSEFKKSFYAAPVQAISFGVIIVCLTNLLFSLMAKREIHFLGWGMAILFFLQV